MGCEPEWARCSGKNELTKSNEKEIIKSRAYCFHFRVV